MVVVGLNRAGRVALPVGIGGLGLLTVIEIFRGTLASNIAPLMGAVLLVAVEFGYWSFELTADGAPTPFLVARRAAIIFGLAVGGAILGGTVATTTSLLTG